MVRGFDLFGGKGSANGTGTPNGSGVLTVSGLSFTPNLVLWEDDTNNWVVGYANNYSANGYYLKSTNLSTTNSTPLQKSGNVSMISGGFTILTGTGAKKWWGFE